jgi:L-ascorbate metabolism protein UlaG (beta-lactamase superfamily)
VGSLAAIGGATWWAATSNRRSARWLRTLVEDSRRAILPAPSQIAISKWRDNAITVGWLGHATLLINFYGTWILTDPVFGDRCGIWTGLGTIGPKRYISPAVAIRELPPIDFVLLSHAHMDHLDTPSLRKIKPRQGYITARLTSDLLPDKSREICELSWGEKKRLKAQQGEVEFEAFEVNHWGQRWPSELERGYNGYIIRREGKSILFGGDTAYTTSFKEIRGKGPFEAAIMPIGAYRPWIRNHCDPEQAVQMANEAGAKYLVPVHHQTWKLSHEPMDEPMQRFEAALSAEPERIGLRRVGEKLALT